MSIIVFAIVVILIIAMLIWGIGYLPFENPPKQILMALVIILGAVIIAQRAGVF